MSSPLYFLDLAFWGTFFLAPLLEVGAADEVEEVVVVDDGDVDVEVEVGVLELADVELLSLDLLGLTFLIPPRVSFTSRASTPLTLSYERTC